ncbi:phospho-N-acetylmuramoyl-pentapeptide-transferase [Vermiculatibacterium agrestimuris]|uniref:phospho-N-acetylmuramoyl-pentapeptide- transferase n=1 Tax=Vermiculatibacterium agrestimuris TaxID=2941519 RepID=UPI00203B7815|nr:phospho-N-acetylmuramoyl-pentapeptide-transferase [Vermiculatibacterium agrestimuris]
MGNINADILLVIGVSFVLTAFLGRLLIPVLRALKAGQSIKEIGPSWHMAKQGTPTMGGLMFIIAIGVVVAGFSFRGHIQNGDFGGLYVFGFALIFGAIGFIDDYMKVVHHENTGLTAGWKFLLQLAAAILMTVLLRNENYLDPNLYIPFVNVSVPLPWPVYMVFAAFVMVGTVNAVNITDGLDGLSSSVTIPVAAFFVVMTAQWNKGELTVFAAALLGGLLGFLLYNHYPAQVFMGDTGSLFLGGAVCGLAFATDMPLVLVLVGIVYIAETLSDIIQVAYFKLTHGKRIFKMAPLHHHFEMCGWKERKVVAVFSAVSILFCLLAYLGVMGRYQI